MTMVTSKFVITQSQVVKFLKMYRITITWLFLLYHFLVIGADAYFDPYEEGDFCELPCNKTYFDEDYGNVTTTVENTACSCRKSPRCRKFPFNATHMFLLRNNFWTAINYYRGAYTEAEDMNIVNYDLSLEYQSYCHAMRCHRVAESQTCERTKKYPIGLNRFIIWKNTKEIPNTYALEKDTLQNLFGEYYPRTNREDPRSGGIPYQEYNSTFRNFACLVWSTYTYLGCAVALKINSFEEVIAHTIVCNLAGPVLCATEGVKVFSPSIGQNSYCKKCPVGKETCTIGPDHTQWPSACGQSEFVSADVWEEAQEIIDPGEPIELEPIEEYQIEYEDMKASESVRLNPFYIRTIIFLIVIIV